MEVGHLRLIVFCLMLSASRSSTATKSDTVLCPVSEYIDDQDKTVTEFFECPGADDPEGYTLCCSDKCCPSYNVDSVLQVDLRIAMVISLTVIIICIISGLIIIICCFVSSCPMYELCTSSGGWTSKGDLNTTLPFPWANEYVEPELNPALPNGKAVSGPDKNHYVAGQLDSKDLEAAEHV